MGRRSKTFRTFSSLLLGRLHFFQDYKQLECNVVEVDEILPATVAYPIIPLMMPSHGTS